MTRDVRRERDDHCLLLYVVLYYEYGLDGYFSSAFLLFKVFERFLSLSLSIFKSRNRNFFSQNRKAASSSVRVDCIGITKSMDKRVTRTLSSSCLRDYDSIFALAARETSLRDSINILCAFAPSRLGENSFPNIRVCLARNALDAYPRNILRYCVTRPMFRSMYTHTP